MIAIGLGARRGTSEEDLTNAVDTVLREAGLTDSDVGVLATIDRRAGEHPVREMARKKGWELAPLTAAELAREDVPNPSDAVRAAVGTGSVAEAAALRATGNGSRLMGPNRILGGVTVAIAETAR